MCLRHNFTTHKLYRTARKKFYTVNIEAIASFLFKKMGWKTLIIKNSEKATLYLDNLLITKRDNVKIRIPIVDIDCILFEDYRTMLSVSLINKIADNKTIIIVCDNNLMPHSTINPINGRFNQFQRTNDQLNWDQNFKTKVWERIIKQKIENQIDVLKINQKSNLKISMLFQYIAEIRDGDITNREGHAAKVYFKELFGSDFTRDNINIVNAALNYGYAIIRSAVSRTIIAKGLHPSISLFHHNQYDSFALSDDLMEPFRPIIDDYVYKKNKDWIYFGRNEKIEMINLLNIKMNYQNKEYYLTNIIEQYIDSIIATFSKLNINFVNFPFVDNIKYYEL